MRFRPVDVVPHDQEVFDEVHAAYYAQFVLGARTYFFGNVAVFLFKPFVRKPTDKVLGSRTVFRNVKRIKRFAAEEIALAFIGYFQRVGKRLRERGEHLFHFLGGFEIKLARGEISVVV